MLEVNAQLVNVAAPLLTTAPPACDEGSISTRAHNSQLSTLRSRRAPGRQARVAPPSCVAPIEPLKGTPSFTNSARVGRQERAAGRRWLRYRILTRSCALPLAALLEKVQPTKLTDVPYKMATAPPPCGGATRSAPVLYLSHRAPDPLVTTCGILRRGKWQHPPRKNIGMQ